MSRITFINRYYYPDHSATAQMLTDLAENLDLTGHKISVVTSRSKYDDAEVRLKPRESINGVDVFRVWTSSFGRRSIAGRAIDYLTFYLSAFFLLLKLTSREDVLVAKTDPPVISVLVCLVAKIKRARLVNWVQDLFPEVAEAAGIKFVSGPVSWVVRVARNWSFRCAQCNVVIGDKMRERLIDIGIAAEQISIIPNWMVGADIKPVDSGENYLIDEWGLRGKFVVGYSGNLGLAHEYNAFLRLITALSDASNIRFLFIGGGAGMTRLKEEVVSKGLTNIVFKPYQDKAVLSYSLSVADIHLISLQKEMEGLVVPSKFYGIIAVGKPMANFADSDGEIGRLVSTYDIGINVESSNPESLAKLLKSGKDVRSMLDIKASNAMDLYSQKFSHGKSIALWQNLLSKSIQSSDGRLEYGQS